MSAAEKARILIVDDDPSIRDGVGAILRAEGYGVVAVEEGHEAIRQATASLPDILLLDVCLPGMTGIDVLRSLKSKPATAGIPVILVTGRPNADDLSAGFECGADEYLSKPFRAPELLARIRSLHRLAEARRQRDAAHQRLRELVTEKTKRLESLYRYARRLDEAHSQEEILELIVEAVQCATDAQRISIFLPEEDGQLLRCVRSVGIDPAVAERLRIDSSRGIVGQVFSTGETIVANDPASIHRCDDRYRTHVYLSIPLISRPLMSQGEVIGVLNVTERQPERPFSPEEIECIGSIANMAAVALHNQIHRQRLEQFVHSLLLTIGRLSEYRDDETANHLERVQRYVEILARQLRRNPLFAHRIDDAFIRDLVVCTPMHDIGKVGVPDGILLKPGPLTTEEFDIMRTHVEIGRETLEFAMRRTGPLPLLNLCVDVIYGHHEAFDGSGYPRGRKGEEIPLAARIVALADAYDAITSRRPYKEPRSHEEAIEIIRSQSGRQFDPDIVDAFLARSDDFDRIRREKAGQPVKLHATMPAS